VPRVLLAIVAILACSGPGPDNGPEHPAQAKPPTPPPHVDFRQRATAYSGPGREQSEPADVSEVLLGYFGPSDPAHPEGGDLWVAARMAVDAANRQGGYHGKPFRLVPSWSENPWQAGISGIARMVYHDKVWAIVGGLDGPTAHLAEQVVAKARLPLVVPSSSDRTANLANVPWIVSLLPGDHIQVPVLVDALVSRVDARGFSLVSLDEHDARVFVAELERGLKRRQLAPKFSHVVPSENDAPAAVARLVVDDHVGAVVVAAGAGASARIVAALRGQGFQGTIVGGPAMSRRRFVREAGAAAEGVLFPLVFDPTLAPRAFVDEFERQAHAPPDYAAAATYDGMNLLIAAVRSAGLNRARIGDALRGLAPWPGVTGTIAWDRMGSNTRAIDLGTVRNGRTVKVTQKSGG
jgi:branched-chain amino acid transport system substrate-binding protein